MWTKLSNGLASLKLTILCLFAAMVLVLAGTFAQIHLGLQLVQEQLFRSLIVWWPLDGHDFRFPVFPGGHLIGAVLLINLITAHLRRFRRTWKNLGIHLTHAGLIVMLAGALFTDLFSSETGMRLSQGETKNYSEDSTKLELALIDSSDAEYDVVTAIPLELLEPGRLISLPALPFSLAVRRLFPNSRLQMLSQAGPNATAAATQGLGAQIAASEAPPVTGGNGRNLVSAVLEIRPGVTSPSQTAGSFGTLLVSEALGGPQGFACDGKRWTISLRLARRYKPYSLKLKKFTHEVYPGTSIAKNYSSAVLLLDDQKRTSRDVLIYMNHPLRYRGDTYYQAGFDDNDTTTILQVVHNPAVVTPYLGCILVGVGLLFQFSLHLVGFSRRVKKGSVS